MVNTDSGLGRGKMGCSLLIRRSPEGCDEMRRTRGTVSGGRGGGYRAGARGGCARSRTQTKRKCWSGNGTRTTPVIRLATRYCPWSPPRAHPGWAAERRLCLNRWQSLRSQARGAGTRTSEAPLRAGRPLRRSNWRWTGQSCRAWRRG